MSDSYQSKTGRYSVKRVLCDDAKAKLAKAREIAKQKREDEKAKLIELEKLKQAKPPAEDPPPDPPEPAVDDKVPPLPTEPENKTDAEPIPKSSSNDEEPLPEKPKSKKIEPGNSSDDEVAKPKKVKKKKNKSKIIISNDSSSSDSDDGAVIYIKSRSKRKSKKAQVVENEEYDEEIPIPPLQTPIRNIRTPREPEPPPIQRQTETISRPRWLDW